MISQEIVQHVCLCNRECQEALSAMTLHCRSLTRHLPAPATPVLPGKHMSLKGKIPLLALALYLCISHTSGEQKGACCT